jgi:histidinol-phosphatase (PHP family)
MQATHANLNIHILDLATTTLAPFVVRVERLPKNSAPFPCHNLFLNYISSFFVFFTKTQKFQRSRTMERINFHTHTRLCKHADGIPADYCREAVEQGVMVLGFSDHTPYPVARWSSVRMDIEQLPQYVEWIRQAQDEFPQLKIIMGMECEYDPEHMNFFMDELVGKWGCKYLIGAAHHYLSKGEWVGLYGRSMDDKLLWDYTDYLIEGISSGKFLFWAHPDVFGVCYKGWTSEADACSKAICEAAASAGIPLEINGYGLRKPMIEDSGEMRHLYPLRKFWDVAGEVGVKVVVCSDAHSPKDVWNNTDKCVEWAERVGLQVVNEELARHFDCT